MRNFFLLVCVIALVATGCGRQGDGARLNKARPADVQPQVTVYVSGFVERPGTYQVPAGTPLGEVIGRAGGYRPEADAAGINQREQVNATMQVYVPKRGEAGPQAAAPSAAEAPSGLAAREAPPVAVPAQVYRGPVSVGSDREMEMLGLMNSERASRGVAPLALDGLLVKIARLKSQDMIENNYFAHRSPRYGPPSAMVSSMGASYHYVGENIAQGQRTVTEAHEGLMGSPGHRQAILSKEFRKVGLGIIRMDNGGLTVTQIFTD